MVVVLFHAVHELAHEIDAAAVLAFEQVLFFGVAGAGIEVEAWAFVANFKDNRLILDCRSDMYAFGAVFAVSAKDSVGECFAQRNGDVERALLAWKREGPAGIGNPLDYRLDFPDIAWDVEVERDVRGGHEAQNGLYRALGMWLEALDRALARVGNLEECVELGELE